MSESKRWLEDDDPLLQKIPFESQAKTMCRRYGTPIPNTRLFVNNVSRFYARVQLDLGAKHVTSVRNALRAAYNSEKERYEFGLIPKRPCYRKMEQEHLTRNGYLGHEGEFEWWLGRYLEEVDNYRQHINSNAEQLLRTRGITQLELGPTMTLEHLNPHAKQPAVEPCANPPESYDERKTRRRKERKARWRRSDLPDDIAWVASRPCLLPERQALKDENGNLPPLTEADYSGAPSPQAVFMLGQAYQDVEKFMEKLFQLQVQQWGKVKPIEAERKKAAAAKSAPPPEAPTVETAAAPEESKQVNSELMDFLTKQLKQFEKQTA